LLDAVDDQRDGSSREVCTIQSNLVLRCSTNLAPGRLRGGAAGKRSDSVVPPKEFNSESQSRVSSGLNTCMSSPDVPVQD
jgi:hypothetical protein